MKQALCTAAGLLGGLIAGLFGGWTGAMTTLVIFMGADWLSGLALGALRRSAKTEHGGLSSAAGFQGLCKKGTELVIVLVAARLDLLMGTDFLRDAVCAALVANEGLSLLENAGRMGAPIPAALRRALDVLQNGEGGHER